jgi:hypothetical protein
MNRYVIYVIFTLLVIASCKKDKTNVVAKSTSSTVYDPKWIPNWVGGDTLYGGLIDTMGGLNGYDTIYTMLIGDTSCILYKGEKMYVWGSSYFNTFRQVVDTFGADESLYENSYIGTVPFDTLSGIKDHGPLTAAKPHKHKLEDGVTWQHQKQTIILHNYVNFGHVNFNVYSSKRTY